MVNLISMNITCLIPAAVSARSATSKGAGSGDEKTIASAISAVSTGTPRLLPVPADPNATALGADAPTLACGTSPERGSMSRQRGGRHLLHDASSRAASMLLLMDRPLAG